MAIKINGDNSVANPGFTGDDTDTGLQVGTDELKLVTGGTARATVDSSGNIGVGTSSPSVKLSIAGTSPQLCLWEGTDGASSSKIQLGTGTVQGFININKGNGTRTVQINSDGTTYFNGGNVGIGTSSPMTDAALTLGASSEVGLGFSRTGSGKFDAGVLVTSGHIVFKGGVDSTSLASLNELMRIDSAGLVMIGTTTEGYANAADNLTIADSGNCGITIRSGTNSLGSIYFSEGTSGTTEYKGYIEYSQSANTMRFATNATSRMTIDSGGNVMVGKATTATDTDGIVLGAGGLFTATRSDSFAAIFNREGGTGNVIEFKSNDSTKGSISVSASAVAYNTTSDYRLKENVVDLGGAIDRVKQLAPKRFNFIVDADTTVDGFLAHEAQTVVPEAVTGTHNEVDDDDNPVYQGIDQSKLVPLLTAALQEAIAKIETLEAEVAALKSN